MPERCQLPWLEIQKYLDGEFSSEEPVQFRLLYSGQVLSASRYDSRASLKHKIRREFHPQLKRLWETNDNLRRLIEQTGFQRHVREIAKSSQSSADSTAFNALCDEILDTKSTKFFDYGFSIIKAKWERAGYKFIPLVTEEFCVRCVLDILFLRPEEPGLLIRSGDIDGRIKTVFDALRMPKNLDEAGGSGPQVGEDPFYCLLEDDKLISEIRVTTDHLLLLPKEQEIKANDAFLVITVKLEPTQLTGWKSHYE
jgi:hypothetical protein